jgi:hypothetical protein
VDPDSDRAWVRGRRGRYRRSIPALQRPRPTGKAPLCFTCDAGFGRGALPPIVGLIVSAAEPSNAAGLGFCRACADRAGWHSSGWQRRLVELGLPQFRKMWADFRIGDALFDIDVETDFPLPAGSA